MVRTDTKAGEHRERLSADERRELVLEAAMEEFAQGGLHGTPTEAIAKRVGVTQPYLFHLFGTKKDLFIGCLRRGWGRVRRTFEQAAEGVPPDEALHAMGMSYLQLLEDRTLLMAQLQGYAACDDPEIREVVREEYAKLYRMVARVSGAPTEDLRRFFAEGMLMTVAAAMDLPALKADWARLCMPPKGGVA